MPDDRGSARLNAGSEVAEVHKMPFLLQKLHLEMIKKFHEFWVLA